MVVIHGAIGEKVWLWLWKQWGGSLGISGSFWAFVSKLLLDRCSTIQIS